MHSAFPAKNRNIPPYPDTKAVLTLINLDYGTSSSFTDKNQSDKFEYWIRNYSSVSNYNIGKLVSTKCDSDCISSAVSIPGSTTTKLLGLTSNFMLNGLENICSNSVFENIKDTRCPVSTYNVTLYWRVAYHDKMYPEFILANLTQLFAMSKIDWDIFDYPEFYEDIKNSVKRYIYDAQRYNAYSDAEINYITDDFIISLIQRWQKCNVHMIHDHKEIEQNAAKYLLKFTTKQINNRLAKL